jgi:hypothetical protein
MDGLRPLGKPDVEVCVVRGEGGAKIIVRARGSSDDLPLTPVGYFAFLQMDGVRSVRHIVSRVDERFPGSGMDSQTIHNLVGHLREASLLVDDPRAAVARDALARAGLTGRERRDPVPESGPLRRRNEEAAEAFDDGWKALVGAEYNFAVESFRRASSLAPTSVRVAGAIEVLDRISAGERGEHLGIELSARPSLCAAARPAAVICFRRAPANTSASAAEGSLFPGKKPARIRSAATFVDGRRYTL